ncbi:MAG: hypothetical protein GY866_20680 [Proteobacteria bacterium]|nr:hypothetical protein [Pseudomonadota bacterium]
MKQFGGGVRRRDDRRRFLQPASRSIPARYDCRQAGITADELEIPAKNRDQFEQVLSKNKLSRDSILGSARDTGRIEAYLELHIEQGARLAFAPNCPSGMIFVPSVGGTSHSPKEQTSFADCINVANVLLHTAIILAEN